MLPLVRPRAPLAVWTCPLRPTLALALAALCAPLAARAAGAGGARPGSVPVQTSEHNVTLPAHPVADTPAAAAAQAAAEAGQNVPAVAAEPNGRAKSQQILEAWRAKHPERTWEGVPAHAPSAPPQSGGEQRQAYGAFTERDEALWQAAYASFVARGHELFHSGAKLGTTVGISCDMCHPNAANTHPETYPKYQVQLGRVAMLRDMINWCLQNPVRAKPWADEDERMKALEAYILSERAHHELAPGKH